VLEWDREGGRGFGRGFGRFSGYNSPYSPYSRITKKEETEMLNDEVGAFKRRVEKQLQERFR